MLRGWTTSANRVFFKKTTFATKSDPSAQVPPPTAPARLRARANMEQLGLLVLLLPFCANALSPAGLWRNPADRELWYELGKAHWERAQATNDGVTSGIGPLHDMDIADSRRFLTAGEAPLWPSPTFRAGSRALDIGAGIGRVSDALPCPPHTA